MTRHWPKPDSWVCAECAGAANGWHQARGVAMFHCDEHEQTICDVLLQRLGYGGVGGRGGLDTTRWHHRVWASIRAPFWRTYYALSPYWRDQRRKQAAALAGIDWHGPRGISDRIDQP